MIIGYAKRLRKNGWVLVKILPLTYQTPDALAKFVSLYFVLSGFSRDLEGALRPHVSTYCTKKQGQNGGGAGPRVNSWTILRCWAEFEFSRLA